MQCNLYIMCFLPFFLCFSSFSLSVISCNPPDLHCDWFDGMGDPVLSPGVPQDVCPLTPALLCIFRTAVEVCQATLVEPPSRLVVLSAAALHSAVTDGAEWIAAIVVHIWGTERSCVLILLLVIATKCITCTETQCVCECTQCIYPDFTLILRWKKQNTLVCERKFWFIKSHPHCLHIFPSVYWRTGFHCAGGNHHTMRKRWCRLRRPKRCEVGTVYLSDSPYETLSLGPTSVLLYIHIIREVVSIAYWLRCAKYNDL